MTEEWLPPGWTVEIRVRKSGKKDRFYFDPSKGQKFNSKPEVLRYLKSIESISEFEGKRRSGRNHSSLDSPAVAKLANSETNGQKINRQCSKLTDTLKDENIIESCAGEEEASVLGPKAKNKNKMADLPRRASKRLAGLEIGSIPELTPKNKTRNDTKATASEEIKYDCPTESSSMPKEQNLSSDQKNDDVAGLSLEVPLQDLWNDPCIEFAIKTLMGQIPIEEELGKNKAFIEVPGPSKESTFGNLWADPCIQFAVKTLTSDIDIPINDSSFPNYFQKRDNGSDLCLGLGGVSETNGLLTSGFRQNENNSLSKAGDGRQGRP